MRGEVYSRDAFSRVSLDENGATLALFDRDGKPVPDVGTQIRW
mgnify:FL=1